MKYANLNNERIEPKKGIVGAVCPICGELVIPKCGSVKMHHWAHKTKQNCDPWWESETEWHRKWKDCFSKEFQEIIMYDNEIGEKHVADVKTKTGFVIEFQHSLMKREEQISRENFYKNMIWVIDAREYYAKFKEHINKLEKSDSNKRYFYIRTNIWEFSIGFPNRWIDSSVPVIFDFGLHDCSEDENDKQKKWIYCVFPEKLEEYGDVIYCCMYITKKEFINRISNNNSFFPNLMIPELKQKLELARREEEQKRLERIKVFEEENRKKKEEYRKTREAAFQKKYPEQEKWRKTIFKAQKKMRNNTLKLIRLHISQKGEITDCNGRIYNGKRCIVTGMKSYYKENKKGIEYMHNDALLLIEDDNRIIFAMAYVPMGIVNSDHLCFDENPRGTHWIRIIKADKYYDKFQLSFEYDGSLWRTRKIRKSLEYIHNKFSNRDDLSSENDFHYVNTGKMRIHRILR